MVITIILAVLVPIAFAVGFYCAVFALKTGLKWQIQLQKGAVPTVEKSDVAPQRARPIVATDVLREIMTGEVSTAGKS